MALDPQRFARLREEGGFFPVEKRALIRVSGADRLRYLNGQVSNDLRRLKEGQAQQALVLTAKGKLCAPLWIWSEGDAFFVEPPAGLAEEVLPRLERYAISDDVAFDLVEETPATWHVFGPAAEALSGGRQISRLGLPGRDVPERPADLVEASPEEITLLRIQHGVPAWGPELDADTLPQEALLERTAVDFHKGCYVGQEVVSRLKSVGRVNERLYGFLGDLTALPPLATITLQNSAAKPVGRLTTALETFSPGRVAALGFASTREEETLFSVVDESGACLGRVERCEFPLNFA